MSQEPLPWTRQAQNIETENYDGDVDAPRRSRPKVDDGYGSGSAYNNGPEVPRDRSGRAPVAPSEYRDEPAPAPRETYRAPPPTDDRYGDPYDAPRDTARGRPENGERYERYEDGADGPGDANGGYYSQGEITRAGHSFFGSVSSGLASAIEYAFKKSGRPNGYILGEDAGGAFVAGLRYGEGTLHTRRFGRRKIFWQGPSVGYDFGAAGSKTMVLVYNMEDPSQMFHRFGGVEGSAYLVGGVSIQFQKYGNVVLAPIRAGVGLRLGANVGYLKYTRRPTWNPF